MQHDSDTSPAGLALTRPLAVIDTESTGIRPETARIVRLSILIVKPDGSESLRSELINPGVPIPEAATAVHGITDEDVRHRPPFRSYARAVAGLLEGCDLAGFGIERFHLPLLVAEFERAGVDFSLDDRAIVDAMAIFHRLEPRDFEAAFKRYVAEGPPPDRSSGARASGILRVLHGQLLSHAELPRDPAALSRWARGVGDDALDDAGRFVRSPSGEPVFNFGKYSGESVLKVAEQDADYLAWVASNDSFSGDARRIAADALEDARDSA